jgi:hypothetical protein
MITNDAVDDHYSGLGAELLRRIDVICSSCRADPDAESFLVSPLEMMARHVIEDRSSFGMKVAELLVRHGANPQEPPRGSFFRSVSKKSLAEALSRLLQHNPAETLLWDLVHCFNTTQLHPAVEERRNYLSEQRAIMIMMQFDNKNNGSSSSSSEEEDDLERMQAEERRLKEQLRELKRKRE